MTVTFKEYETEKIKFFSKQKGDMKAYTSPMEHNRYHKEYIFENGASWYEVTELVTETVEVQAFGVAIAVDVNFWRTEYYTSSSPSKYVYERA